MMRRDAKGVESLPMLLLLGVALAACTLGLGVKCLSNAQTASERQRAIGGFNAFIERARMVEAGGIGSVQRVELELAGSRITTDAKLVQLIDGGGGVLRSEILQLPIRTSDNQGISDGVYAIELKRDAGGYFLEVRRL